MHSSYMTNNNNNIISSSSSSSSSNTAATLYPFPPYNFPFSSSSSSSLSPYNINNTHHHPFLPQEHTTTGGAGFFGLLNSDQFSLLNRPCFPAPRLPESSVGGFYGSSSYRINDNHNNISHHHPAYFVSSNYNKDDQPAKVPVKKVDRHSKIFTSQGLRDRRVRLSINIAREFFDLQDLLGFDKASKTLEWLLTKSRDAIRDLQEAAGNSSTSLSFSSTYSDDDCDGDVSKNQEAREKRRKMKEAAAVVARATRAKARARARERTREKGQSSKISGCSQQLKSLSNLKSLADDHELNPEIIRTWTASTSSNWCSSQINIQFPNAAATASHQNWNINDGGVVFTCPSNSCAINTTMNPNSTGV